MGKLIVFWAPVHGQSKVTSSMSAVSLALGDLTGNSVLMTHTQYGFSALESLFDFKQGLGNRELYDGSGLSALVMNFKRSEVTVNTVRRAATLVEPSESVFLMSGVERNVGVNTDTDDILYTLITKHVKNAYDYVFVDLASGRNKLSERLIKASDVFVVCLTQNMDLWDSTLETVKEFNKENTFYLFTGYRSDSKFSINNLIKKGRNYGLTTSNTGTIKNNTAFMDAVSEGLVSLFYYRNNKAVKKEHAYEFINSCQESARKIQRMIEGGGK